MVASFRKICSNCMGLSGNISIVKDFYGYSSVPAPFPVPSSRYIVPGTLSLLQQVKLLKQAPLVRLHIKIAVSVDPSVPTIDQMVNAIRLVYGNYGIGVVIKSTENLNLSDVDIEAGDGGNSSELIQLFNNTNNVGTNEIVVYIVSTVTSGGDTWNGWSNHPAGKPGVVLAGGLDGASIWTLAHEIGHVLGLLHPELQNFPKCPKDTNPPSAPLQNCLLKRLMTCCSTENITNLPPDLVQSEVQTMLNSNLTFTC
jgi:hypothetical protein